MKLYYLLFVFTFCVLNGQKKNNDSLAKVLLENNAFKKNNFDKKYLIISSFVYGNKKLAQVKTEKGWGFMNKKGIEVIPAVFDTVQDYQHSISAFYKKQDSTEEKLKCEKTFNFEGKELVEICQRDYMNVKKIENSGKYLKITKGDNEVGIINIEGKTIIPLKYSDVILFGNYFFCEVYDSKETKHTKIFDTKGRFIKNIPSTNIQTYMEKKNLVQVIDNYGLRYLLSLKTLEPVTEKYDWGQFDDYSDNPNFYIRHYEFGNEDNSYILNKDFQVINKDYPGSHPFSDKFLIQRKINSKDSVTILNLKGKMVAKYDYNDFLLYDFFAPFHLDNPKFLNENKTLFPKYENIGEMKYSYRENYRYRYFVDNTPYGNGERISLNLNILDVEQGKILFSIPRENIKEITDNGKVNPDFFIVYDNGITKIYNKKGEILKTLNFMVRKEEYSSFPSHVIKKGVIVNIFDEKSYKKIFSDDIDYVTSTYNPDIFIIGKGGKFGLADIKGNILKPLIHSKIDGEYMSDIYNLSSENKFEQFNVATQKTEFSMITNGIPINHDNGIIQFGKNAWIDMYGNYFQNDVKPEPKQVFKD